MLEKADKESQNQSSNHLIPLTFLTPSPKKIYVEPNQTLLQIAHRNKIDLEGACEGSLACSTCHVILDKKQYNKYQDEITDREYDLLDQAYCPTSMSRLGCQIVVDERMRDGVVKIPKATRNMAVDGHKPQPH